MSAFCAGLQEISTHPGFQEFATARRIIETQRDINLKCCSLLSVIGERITMEKQEQQAPSADGKCEKDAMRYAGRRADHYQGDDLCIDFLLAVFTPEPDKKSLEALLAPYGKTTTVAMITEKHSAYQQRYPHYYQPASQVVKMVCRRHLGRHASAERQQEQSKRR